jgi:two-component system chemotaxis family response regulator WspR
MGTNYDFSAVEHGAFSPSEGGFAGPSPLEIENAGLQLRLKIVQLQRLVYLDALTGLGNRRYFNGILVSELRRAARTEQPLTLLICDVDRFKECNDTYGHAVGDRVLVEIAGVLKRFSRRGGDFAIRYAGDEFALLLPGVKLRAAQQLAENIRSTVATLTIGRCSPPVPGCVTLSIGGAAIESSEPYPALRLVEAADRALYLAKRAGRNRARLVSCG